MAEAGVLEHRWVGAAYVTLASAGQASYAARRGSIRVPQETRVDVLEVYCGTCKRPYDDVIGEPCSSSHHLRGGPIGERKKRKGVVPDEPE